jgi:predicted aspartyl protease
MYQLEFTTSHSYESDREGISVPVLLKSGPNSVRIAASIDTGATFCIFRNELAEALGLDLANSAPKRFRTATGSFEAFGHEVEISVLGVTTLSTVYFFADAAINRNVLGRVGWLDRVRLALVDHDSTLYLAPYANA